MKLEGSFGFLTQQVKAVHTDLLEFQKETVERFDKVDARLDKVDARLDKVDARFDKVDARFDNVETRLDRVEQGIQSLRNDLPDIVAGAVGEALRR